MKIKTIVATVMTASAALILAACGNNNTQSSNSTSNKVINSEVNAELQTLDPSKYSDSSSSEAIQNSYEGLYTFNAKNKPVLAGAEKVSVSKDKKTYTFTLRKSAKWSNGDPVTAEDYVFGWRRTADPKTASPNTSRFAFIANGDKVSKGDLKPSQLGIKALGKYKLQVTLEQPIAYIDELLTGIPFFPQDSKLVQKYGKSFGTSSTKAVYNGPFTVNGWTGSDLNWTYKKNKYYWNKSAVKLNQVNMQVVKTPNTALNLYRESKLDYVPLSGNFIKQYKNDKNLHSQLTPMIGYFGFNTKRKTTGNVHVRRALGMAVDKKLLVKNVIYAGAPLNGIVPANFAFNTETGTDYRKDAGDMLPFDVTKARAEWKQAQKTLGKKITIELLTSDTDESKLVGEFLQSNLMKNLPSLTVKLRSIPLKSRLASTTAYNFDVVYGTWSPDFADPVNFIADGGSYHLATDYKNSKYEQDLADAAGKYATNPKKRWNALIDAEKQVVQKDAFMVPIYQGGQDYLLSSRVNNFQISPYGGIVFYKNAEVK
ncbi:peptide ABC transporter substrate-binding protein [Lactobacillus gigeriorum]|uniref:Oligopeptide ABC superfamily ATP binding cassette transporter, binding protein n=1 Tax=Lactobacillus gigeriorum DSM 23908 = CRBIP 24.85 TaxID=1423751 RepID=I7J1E2_9LACO|nr:peptide ABC transporter substrate-binding protein [Lactobacillus gigeriorum]KRN09577.1 oligopeptide ABC superfamily ATP binding cassette transporter, binding protein [Lactobacillus gigeriorum DSM 23908 = CRBIP 24.85]CCI86262.1 Oligopeptide ABC superfamily ATP binding cassette transporter, binding protein [Lactobacillus gigeriorum DSM 23908 = CRBIP 24.85]